MLPGVRRGLLDRVRMKVVADKLRLREGFGHQHGRPAVTAPDIGDFGTRCNLSTTPLSAGSQVLVVAGAEKARDRAEEAAIAPRHSAISREHRLDLILA